MAIQWHQFIDSWIQGVRRFPLSLMATLVASVCIMMLSRDSRDSEFTIKVLSTAALAFPSLMAARLFAESSSTNWIKWSGFIVVILCLAAWYLWGYESEDVRMPYYFIPYLITAHLLVGLSGYLMKRDDVGFWVFNQELAVTWILGMVYGLILALGISAAVMAVEYLFEYKWYRDIYADIFNWMLIVFSSFYFCSNVPKSLDQSLDEFDYHKLYQMVVKFIFIPLIILYFIILYSYGLKILFQWDLPKGWVSSLCLGFSAAGILVYLFNYYLVHWDKSKLLGWYKKYFITSLIPVIILMFVAIYRRISDYGITEERYWVALACVWLILLVFNFVILKKSDLNFFPLSIGVVLIFSTMGPIGSTQVSIRNQNKQLHKIAEKYGLMEVATWKKDQVADEEVKYRVESILSYLQERKALESWIQKIPEESVRKNISGMKDYEKVYEISDYIFEGRRSDARDDHPIEFHQAHFSFTMDSLELREYDCDIYNSGESEARKIYINQSDQDLIWLSADRKEYRLHVLDSLLKMEPELFNGDRLKEFKPRPIMYEWREDRITLFPVHFRFVKNGSKYEIEYFRVLHQAKKM